MISPLNSARKVEPILDRGLWLAVAGLMAIGAAFIYSATGGADQAAGLPWWRLRVMGQAAAYLIGMGVVAGFCCIDYARLARWSLVGYWAGMAALLAVPFFGAARLGARRWLDLGPVQFQPSEFAKLAFLFAMANYLARPPGELASPAVFARALGMAFFPFVLILKQPDLGSALVFIPVTLVMMYVAGVPRLFLLRLVGGASAAVVLLMIDILLVPPKYRFIKIEQYQRERLLVYFGLDFADASATPAERLAARLEQDKKSYNVRQALISVGSGGLWGKGWREGTQGALGYLPRAVAHNDFIFSVIAEEKGFLGSVTVLALYGVTLFRGIQIASEARDRLGRLLAAGVVTLLFTHVFINIGMNIRLMPVTGIPLPLLSAGGTSVLCSLVAIGILQNIQIWRRR